MRVCTAGGGGGGVVLRTLGGGVSWGSGGEGEQRGKREWGCREDGVQRRWGREDGAEMWGYGKNGGRAPMCL